MGYAQPRGLMHGGRPDVMKAGIEILQKVLDGRVPYSVKPPAEFQPKEAEGQRGESDSDEDDDWQVDDMDYESEEEMAAPDDLFEAKGCDRKGLGSGSIQSRKRQGKKKKVADEEAKFEKDMTLRPGRKVKIEGLKAAPEFNNQIGVCETFIEETGRWEVRLANGDVKAFKVSNLEAVVSTSVGANRILPEGTEKDATAFEQDE